MTMEYWWWTETELVRLQQCLAINTHSHRSYSLTKHNRNLCTYQVSGYGLQYRTSLVHAFITHCVCTWLLTI